MMMNDPTYAEMDLLEELGDEIHIKAEELSDLEDETEIEAVFFSDSLLHELKDENEMEADLSSTYESEMEGNAPTQEGLETLSDKSYNRYLQAYETFKKWQESKELNSFDEPVLLDYFHELATKYKPSSLSFVYRMLKHMILYNHKINISEYREIIKFLKKKRKEIRNNKSKLFTADDVNKFLVEAPDDKYLAMKVVLVFGVIGTNHNLDSITNVMTDHVMDNGSEIIVRLFDTKTKVVKEHVIGGQFAAIVRKYMKVRPRTACTERFFMQYRDGKCINQVIGKNKIAKVPKEIPKFLKLSECEAYTGYSYRITPTSISTDIGIAIETRHEQWKRSRIDEENVQVSFGHERKMIAEELNFPSTSNVIIVSHENASVRIVPATIMNSESSLLQYEELSDESTGDIPENSSSFENEDASTQKGLETLPEKSHTRYLNVYEGFKKWQESKKVNSFAEPVVLDYFRELSEKNKPSTLWTVYSILKSTIFLNHNVSISAYSQLIKFLKENAGEFRSKKANIFTAEDITRFLVEAPDDQYLAMKTVVVFGLIGACSLESITYVKKEFVKDTGNEIIVKIFDRKSKTVKAHVIDGQFAEIVRKYMKLRPSTADTERFFMLYRSGRCMNQVIGKNTISKVPKKMAKFLNLSEPEDYNGFSFRITAKNSSTHVVLDTLKQVGLGRSSGSEGNVPQSFGHNRQLDSLIAGQINLPCNVVTASHENTSKRIANVPITTSESSSCVYEISDESTGDMPENNSLSQNEDRWDYSDDNRLNMEHRIEVENFRYPPPLSYFKTSDASMREAPNEGLPIKNSDVTTHEALETLSDESYSQYINAYEVFKTWQEFKKVNSFAEPVLLDYFRELSTKYEPLLLWNLYRMLKRTILSYHNINISEYSQLIVLLKEKTDGFQSKRSKVFTADDVTKFLVEAPDYEYLAMKTVLVFALIGACRADKIINVMTDNVTDNGNEIIVRNPDAATNVAKPHIINGQFAEIVRKYIKLRPITTTTQRFFIQYQNGKCMDRVMDRNNVAQVPKQIAKFLKLPESEAYTGYSFRSTSKRSSTDTGIEKENAGSTSNVIIASHESALETISPVTIASSESSVLNEEIIHESTTDMSDNSSSSESEESSESNDDTRLSRNHRPKASKRKRKRRPKRQKEINWYDEECLAQIKLTTDMFKRFSKMGEDEKMKMLSELSMDRVELFKKYFAAMSTINNAAHNGGVTDPNGTLP